SPTLIVLLLGRGGGVDCLVPFVALAGRCRSDGTALRRARQSGKAAGSRQTARHDQPPDPRGSQQQRQRVLPDLAAEVGDEFGGRSLASVLRDLIDHLPWGDAQPQLLDIFSHPVAGSCDLPFQLLAAYSHM